MKQRSPWALSASPLVLAAGMAWLGGGCLDLQTTDETTNGAGGVSMTSAGTNSTGQTSSGAGGNGANSASSSGDASSSSSASSSSTTASSSSSSGGGSPICGNLMCEAGETCMDCAEDCSKGSGPQTTGLDAEEMAFVGLINQHRASNGVGPLKTCVTLNRTAQGHSEDMRDKNYFSHTGINGSTVVTRSCDACYAPACPLQTAMSENIAAGNSGAQGTFTQWKNSPGHNTNMLSSSAKVMGIGRATGGGQYGVYWTNVFGGTDDGTCQ